MKIVLWIGKGAHHKALANKINAIEPLAGIVVENPESRKNYSIKKIAEKIFERIFLREIDIAWNSLLRNYEKDFPEYPEVPLIKVENINNSDAFNFTTEIRPDLIIVSGTRLVRKKMLSILPEIGILNLHTGLSPYVKGGPNCTNWCISNNELHLIGNTVMWIDEGVDTGNVFATEFTDFSGDEDLFYIHNKVMGHAHQLVIGAIKRLIKGEISNYPQSIIGVGKTFRNKDWTLKQKIKLKRNLTNFKTNINSEDTKNLKKSIVVKPL